MDELSVGIVVPKRHARRAVTRTLVKRQVRAAVARHADALPGGLCVIRLRAALDRQRFTSASSPPLRDALRHELDELLARRA